MAAPWTPTEKEVRRIFEDIRDEDAEYYVEMRFSDLLLGYCIGKGMQIPDAVRFVKENEVIEE